MKVVNFIRVTILVIILGGLLALAACAARSNDPVRINGAPACNADVRSLEYRGHKYLLFVIGSHYAGVVHDPECCVK